MIRTILGSVREYKAATFQTIFLAAIEAVFEIVIPFWMSYLIDRGIEAGDMRQVAIFGGLLLLFAALPCYPVSFGTVVWKYQKKFRYAGTDFHDFFPYMMIFRLPCDVRQWYSAPFPSDLGLSA